MVLNNLKLLEQNVIEAQRAVDMYRSSLFVENWLDSNEIDNLLPKVQEIAKSRDVAKIKRTLQPFMNDLLYTGQLIEATEDERKGEIMREYKPLRFPFLRESIYSGLNVFAATQGTGKSSMLFNILFELMKAGKRVLYIDCENQTREFDFKFYQLYQYRKHLLTISFESVVRDQNNRTAAVELMQKLKPQLHLVAHQTPSGPEIAGYCLNMDNPVNAVIVDYIQLLRGTNPKNTIRENIIENVQALRELANQLDIPVFIASQMNANQEMRESQSILDNATLAIFMQRTKDEDGTIYPRMDIHCRKNRRGAIEADYQVDFEPICQAFGSYDK